MPILAVGEDHTGQEGAERRTEPDHLHQQCDADHEQQGRRGEDLAQPGPRDGTEHGAQQEASAADDHRDRGEHGDGLLPPGKCGDAVCLAARRDRQRGQQRQHREDRDHGDVLREQDREHPLARVGAQPTRLRQALEDDGRRRHRDDQPDGEGGLPATAGRDADGGGQQRRTQNLRAAEAEYGDAHAPQHRRAEFESDQEQHHHDAELGDMQDVLAAIGHELQSERPDGDARQQVAEHGAHPQPTCDGHRRDRGREIDERLEQEVVVHQALGTPKP